ncbi:MAG: AAA family ATPase, partial [Saprospiraceae bacterium]|nr:AAA family ATPase [Saprospiraceae bacterium]
MKYCGSCGKALTQICPQCVFENPADFNFCGNCGTSLAQDDELKKSKFISREPLSRGKGERRHLTVVFCDLVGSTSLSHELDPEDLQKIVKQYQNICDKVITRYEGHVAQYLGDGILIYFGFPVAHENSAHRAVSSGLGIIEAIERFSQKVQNSHGVQVAVRIGIHTGHVVIGDIGRGVQSQQLAMGSTPNIAARLEGLAAPNSLVISQKTHELIRGRFQCEDLGLHQIKGTPRKMTIYQVIAENTARVRFEEEEIIPQTRLVGRGKEYKLMHELWDLAKKGQSQVIQLSGEAGVGKSRLLKSLIKSVASETDAWLNLHYCSPYHTHTSYYPVANILTHVVLQYKADESPQQKIDRLEGFLLQYGFDLEEYVPLMANILSINLDNTSYSPSPFSADQQKQRIARACITTYLERARQQNLLLVFEDLQWIDQPTLDIITEWIHQAPTSNVLTVLTYRPEFNPPWRLSSHITPIILNKLESESSREIIRSTAMNKALPEEIVKQIILKTDGIPLFVEELTKMVLGSDMLAEYDNHYELTRPIEELAIPSTLHDSLVARLDRMHHTKEVAQLGAVIGRDFSYELIRAASAMDESDLADCLAELVNAELLSQKGYPPNSTYRFRHALIQDAAYQSLLKSQCKHFHKRIANSVLNDLPNLASEQPEILAYHFEKSGLPVEAIIYWLQACERIQQYQALEDLLHFISRGLSLLDQVNDPEKKVRMEFALRSFEAPAFLVSEGFASASANQAYSRIRELGIILKDREAVFRGLRGIATYELFTGKPRKGLSYAQDALHQATDLERPDLMMEGHRI